MEPRQVKTAADALQDRQGTRLSHVKVGVHDIDGILRGKYMHIDKFISALEGGMGFCDVVLGWDTNDQLYDNVTYTGWHTGYPDAHGAHRCRRRCREIATGARQCCCSSREFADRAEELCPRGVLRRVLARAAEDGLRGQGRLRIRVLRVRRDAVLDPRRRAIRNLADLARLLRLFGAAQLRPCPTGTKGPARHVRDHGHGHRGPATETGAGVLRLARA